MNKNFNRIKNLIAQIVLFCGAISMLVPFLWMILTSFMGSKQIFSYPPVLIPHPFVNNYSAVASAIPVWQYFLNSAFVAVVTTIGQVLISSLAAYAFGRLKFRGREPLFLIFLATMMIPPQVNIIPLFFADYLHQRFKFVDLVSMSKLIIGIH